MFWADVLADVRTLPVFMENQGLCRVQNQGCRLRLRLTLDLQATLGFSVLNVDMFSRSSLICDARHIDH